VDGNSDGISQADELKTLAQLGVAAISTGANSTWSSRTATSSA
jgi:hypothetical protein